MNHEAIAKAESYANIDAMVAQKRAAIGAFAAIDQEIKNLINEIGPATVQESVNAKPLRPKDSEIIVAIIAEWGVSFGTACDWIIQAAESIQSKP
jgi:ADP-dependent phosphofructokinase/glucokinase